MRKQLLDKINMVKKDIKIRMYDEATVKQTIILNFLNILDWNIFDSSEVVPEYTVGSRRVDYSLRLKKKDYIFIEVKRPSEDLDKHEEQLLDYAFRQGIEFAILTNSITWWFYLPLKTGSWSNRKFFSIDLEEREDEIII